MSASVFRHPQSTPARQNDFNMKAPKPPDKPLVPYMRFSRKMWAKVRSENPEAQLWDIGKIIGQMWRELADADKSVYQQEFDVERVEHEKAMKAYHNSPAYQNYMNAKSRAKANEKISRSRMDAGGVVIQPVDEEDAGNELSSRRLAAVRFDRNHRLVADLFNSAIVNDSRTIVAQNRMDMLRKQAQSLTTHQSKLEEELVKLNDVHRDKKRQIDRCSEEFAEKLKRVCEEKPVLDESRLEELIEEKMIELKAAYEEEKKRKEEESAKQAAEREKMAEETPVLAELVMGSDDSSNSNKEDEKKEEEEDGKTEDVKEKEDKKEEEPKAEEESTPMEEDTEETDEKDEKETAAEQEEE